MGKKLGENKICIACGKEYYVKLYLLKESKFCSRYCQNHKQFIDNNGKHYLVNKYLKEKKLNCKYHGIHNEFYIKKNNERPKCRICLRNANKKWDELHWFRNIIRGCKNRAKRKNLEFNITEKFIDALVKKQNNKCALSKIQFILEKSDNQIFSPSIDRIDSSKGYTENNVQIVCKIINVMKTDLPQKEFIRLCKRVALGKRKK